MKTYIIASGNEILKRIEAANLEAAKARFLKEYEGREYIFRAYEVKNSSESFVRAGHNCSLAESIKNQLLAGATITRGFYENN